MSGPRSGYSLGTPSPLPPVPPETVREQFLLFESVIKSLEMLQWTADTVWVCGDLVRIMTDESIPSLRSCTYNFSHHVTVLNFTMS